uniref:Uncharacterized protein n=1 Tax=Caenorhabditis japonica TaxID=281687 RepID=A0A8R1IFC5_CAEJA
MKKNLVYWSLLKFLLPEAKYCWKKKQQTSGGEENGARLLLLLLLLPFFISHHHPCTAINVNWFRMQFELNFFGVVVRLLVAVAFIQCFFFFFFHHLIESTASAPYSTI